MHNLDSAQLISNKGEVTCFSSNLLGLLGSKVDSSAGNGEAECCVGSIVVSLVSDLGGLGHEARFVVELLCDVAVHLAASLNDAADVGVAESGPDKHASPGLS
jgi:hypothetical protein